MKNILVDDDDVCISMTALAVTWFPKNLTSFFLEQPRVLATGSGQLLLGGCQPSQEDVSWLVEGSNHSAGKAFHLKNCKTASHQVVDLFCANLF